jgi:hypothetical protein
MCSNSIPDIIQEKYSRKSKIAEKSREFETLAN